MTKGSLVLLGMILFFILACVATYLWYDLRLEQIDRTLQHLHLP